MILEFKMVPKNTKSTLLIQVEMDSYKPLAIHVSNEAGEEIDFRMLPDLNQNDILDIIDDKYRSRFPEEEE